MNMNINKENLDELLRYFIRTSPIKKNTFSSLHVEKKNIFRINSLKSKWGLSFKNLYDLRSIYYLVRFHFITNPNNILFILPEEKKYEKINKEFIEIFNLYDINFIHNKSFKKVLGFLTNFKQLNIVQNKNLKNKKPSLIIMFNTDDFYKNGVIKEADLLNIPIISLKSSDTICSKLYMPLIGNLNYKTFNFYHHFFWGIIYYNNFFIKNDILTKKSKSKSNLSLITDNISKSKSKIKKLEFNFVKKIYKKEIDKKFIKKIPIIIKIKQKKLNKKKLNEKKEQKSTFLRKSKSRFKPVKPVKKLKKLKIVKKGNKGNKKI